MKVRFQADADLNEIIVGILQRRAPEIDFSTAAVAGLEGLSDPEVLAIAAADGRVLVSHDQTTMPTHFGEFITAQESPGVLIIPQHLSLTVAAGGHARLASSARNRCVPCLLSGLNTRRRELRL
jgi:predicted nuclease of predicted toxin-antitoxin system